MRNKKRLPYRTNRVVDTIKKTEVGLESIGNLPRPKLLFNE
jgi:hypothetical protein